MGITVILLAALHAQVPVIQSTDLIQDSRTTINNALALLDGKIIYGNGAPTLPCSASQNLGKLYIDQAAQQAQKSVYNCARTGVFTYEWEILAAISFAELTGAATDAQIPDDITIGLAALMPGGLAGGDWWDLLQLVQDGTNLNTANALVKRDGSGNFAAGTITARSYQLNPSSDSRPTCAVGERGKIWQTYGGTGVADTVAVCAKDSSDVYAWRTIY